LGHPLTILGRGGGTLLELLNRSWIRAITLNLKREEGQTMTEYAVVLTLIAIALVTTIGTLRNAIITVISNAAAQV
jgi:Flp pilus assembly pilin Flp